MPKLSTPDTELKAEFAGLKTIAKEEAAARRDLAKVLDKKRSTISNLARKRNANTGSMAAIFGVSRQALAKEVLAWERANPKKAAKAPASKPASKPAAKTAKKAVAAKPAEAPAEAKPAPAKATKKVVRKVIKKAS